MVFVQDSTGTSTLGYIQYCSFDYCRNVLELTGREDLKNPVRALYCYHAAAEEYGG